MRARNRVRTGLVAMLAAGTLAGCGGGEVTTPQAGDRVFAGLDEAVVKEVLASRVATERVAGDEPTVAAARYQGMVRNFIACRSALSSYREWVNTGIAPQLQAQPIPVYPAPTAIDMDRDIKAFQDKLASGDITLLRDALTNPTGCGNWIPAKPGDQDGPTIAEAVKGATS